MSQTQSDEIQRRAQASWGSFCEELKRAGSQLLRSDLRLDELDAAEGLRYLSRLVRTGLERHVEAGDPAAPYLHVLCDERIKGFGGDNPDTRYFGATISSEYAYRIRGDFRSCSYFTLMTTGFDETGSYRFTGSVDGDAMPASRERPIEIVMGKGVDDAGEGARAGDAPYVLPTTAETTSLLVRCNFENAEAKAALTIALERIDSCGEPVVCQFEPISKGLLETAKFVRTTAELWCNQSAGLRKAFNEMPLTDPERMRKLGGDPNIFYYSAAWAVSEDELLVIRLSPIPECRAWGFQLNNLWTESLDYTQSQTQGRIHLNKQDAQTDPDGGVTIIVSERDPGHPNWLCTMGHRSGTANLRLMGAKEPVIVEIETRKSAGRW